MPGPMQLVVILVIVILLFGTKRLKNIGSDLGDALKGFKKAVKDEEKKPSDTIEEKTGDDVIEGEVIREKEKEKSE
jgi:sec-independent protein translocase protein TatA